MLEKKGLVTLETTFADGIKIKANANRYTFVWGSSIKRHKAGISEQLEELWSYTEEIAREKQTKTSAKLIKF